MSSDENIDVVEETVEESIKAAKPPAVKKKASKKKASKKKAPKKVVKAKKEPTPEPEDIPEPDFDGPSAAEEAENAKVKPEPEPKVTDEVAVVTVASDLGVIDFGEAAPVQKIFVDSLPNAGELWWNKYGAKMLKRGHGQRNIILKASYAACATFDQAMAAMRGRTSVEEKAKSLFK